MRSFVVLVLAIASASGAELVVRDARLGLDLLPVDFDYTLADSTGERSGSDAFATNYGLIIGARYSLARTGASHGAVVGLDLGISRATYEPADGLIGTYTLAGEGGYGWALNDDLALVGSVRLGLGAATASFHGSGAFQDFSPAGPLLDYGARLSLAWTVTERIILDGTLGWRTAITTLSDSGRELEISNGGFLVSLGMSWRFTSSPWRLE